MHKLLLETVLLVYLVLDGPAPLHPLSQLLLPPPDPEYNEAKAE